MIYIMDGLKRDKIGDYQDTLDSIFIRINSLEKEVEYLKDKIDSIENPEYY